MRVLPILLLGCWSAWGTAQELRWGFAMADGMPYVEVKNQELQGGFTHRLGTLTSQRLGVAIRFVETPNKRVEKFIQRGRIHVICNNNPEWLAEPQRYHWSSMLYQEDDVLLLHRQQPPISSLKELHGKVLGTRLGYVYNTALMEAFARKRVTRQDSRELGTNLYLLSKQRIDAIIDMRRSLNHALGKHSELPLNIGSWVIQRYDLPCVYSPHSPISAERLDEVLQGLRDEGVIARLLNGEA